MKKIDWTKWSAIAEILGAIAIVLTLIYLSVQTSQNTEALLSSSRQAALDADLGLLYELLDRPNLVYPGGRIAVPGSEFTEEELTQLVILGVANMRIRESLWFQYVAGAIDRRAWESYRDVLITSISDDAEMQVIWDRYSGSVDPEFRQEIESQLTE